MVGCSCGNVRFEGLSATYRRALWWVIAINFTMFVVEMTAGRLAGSQALKADSLDFLGDTLTYGLTLAVIGQPLVWRARMALFKGLSLAAMGLFVLGSTLYATLVLGQPSAPIMGAIGLLALAANLTSVLILMRYRNGDANVRSVWLCSRNDAIGNLAVIVAALLVFLSASPWPDIMVAFLLCSLFLHSAWHILRQAKAELVEARAVPA
ncbi:MAG: cation transporter [Geminicoccaceae bacterium]|nr:MAG: cation transporter [Geminicoccaceae bacterium]